MQEGYGNVMQIYEKWIDASSSRYDHTDYSSPICITVLNIFEGTKMYL